MRTGQRTPYGKFVSSSAHLHAEEDAIPVLLAHLSCYDLSFCSALFIAESFFLLDQSHDSTLDDVSLSDFKTSVQMHHKTGPGLSNLSTVIYNVAHGDTQRCGCKLQPRTHRIMYAQPRESYGIVRLPGSIQSANLSNR